jgi:hypothetical protein
MVKRLAKPLLWLLTTAIPVFIAACYGAPACLTNGGDGDGDSDDDYEDTDPVTVFGFRGRVVSALSSVAIPYLRVTCGALGTEGAETVDTTYTKPDGSFELWYPDVFPCDFLRFEDADGALNGSFVAQEIPFAGAVQDDVYELETEG